MTNLNWPKTRSLLAGFLSLSLAASAVPASVWAVDAGAFGREASETRIISPVVIPESDWAIGNNIFGGESDAISPLLSGRELNVDAAIDAISSDKENAVSRIPAPNEPPSTESVSVKDHFLSQQERPGISSPQFKTLNDDKALVLADEVRRGVATWEDGRPEHNAIPKDAPGRFPANSGSGISLRYGSVTRSRFASEEGRERQEGATNAQDHSSADLTRLAPPILLLSGPKADLPLPQKTPLPGDGAPKTSKFKSVMRWALPILSMTAVIVGLDIATKLLAKKYLLTEFHDAPWRAPFIAVIIPYMGFTAYKARAGLSKARKLWQWSIDAIRNGRFGFNRIEVSGTDGMMKKHPSLRWAVRLYDVSIAMMMGGLLGNGLDMLRLGGALDWIPLGRSLLNLADVSLLIGLAFFQLATNFFISAGEADSSGKSLRFSVTSFLGLPLLGFFIAWTFGSAPGGDLLDLAMKNIEYLYLIGFSMLLGISRYIAATIVGRFASRFTSESEDHKNQGS